MAINSSFVRDSVMRISRIKSNLLRDMPFYGILLGYFKFSLDDSIDSVCTDGERIFFNPKFLALIDDDSLRFILLHEALHMALGHHGRRNEYDPDIFDLSSDIVVNSNIFHSFSDDESKITISVPSKYQKEYRDIIGTAPHKLPDGSEGYNYTVDYVYSVLKKSMEEELVDEYEGEYLDSLFDDGSDYLDQDADYDDDEYSSDGEDGDFSDDYSSVGDYDESLSYDSSFDEDSEDLTSDEEYSDSSEDNNEEESEEETDDNEESESSSSSSNKKKRKKSGARKNSGDNEESGEESGDEDCDEESESSFSSSNKKKRKKSGTRKNSGDNEKSGEESDDEDGDEESESNSSSTNKKKRKKSGSRKNAGDNEESGEESDDEDGDEESESNSSSSDKKKRKKSGARKNSEDNEESNEEDESLEESEYGEEEKESEIQSNNSSEKSQNNKSMASNSKNNKNKSSSGKKGGSAKSSAKGKAKSDNKSTVKGGKTSILAFGSSMSKRFAKSNAIKRSQKRKCNSNQSSHNSFVKTKNHTNSIREVKKKRFDDHERWRKDEVGQKLKKEYEWKSKIKTILNVIGSNDRGLLPLGALINLELEEKNARLDWKTLLQDFLALDEKDYSFTPPDKRYDSSPFFLPDFNLEEMKIKNILVFVDTSGSMPHAVIKEILEEIKTAISDSNCGLKGWLGLFDAQVSKPVPIDEECDIKDIDVCGGGGTSFSIVFEYIKEVFRPEIESQGEEIAAILMITDGCCTYPEEKNTDGTPVMWIMTTKNEAPWEKTVHFYDNNGGNNAGL